MLKIAEFDTLKEKNLIQDIIFNEIGYLNDYFL